MGKIFIKKYQYKNSKNKTAHLKWFGRVVHLGTIDTDGLARHIMEHGSVYTDDVVLGVTRKLMRCMAELLAEGNKVKLDGIGTLYINCQSMGVEDPEDYDPQKHITGLRVRFLGDQSNDSLYSKSGLKRVLMTGNLAKFGVAEENTNSGGGNSGGSDPVVDDQP